MTENGRLRTKSVRLSLSPPSSSSSSAGSSTLFCFLAGVESPLEAAGRFFESTSIFSSSSDSDSPDELSAFVAVGVAFAAGFAASSSLDSPEDEEEAAFAGAAFFAAFLATTGAFLTGAASSSLDESELDAAAFGAGFLTVSKIRSVSYSVTRMDTKLPVSEADRVSEGVLSHGRGRYNSTLLPPPRYVYS